MPAVLGEGLTRSLVAMQAELSSTRTIATVFCRMIYPLLDPPDQIRKKIMRAATDSQQQVDFEQLGAGVRNLIEISQAFMSWKPEQTHAEFNGMRYGDLKKKVAEIVATKLEPIQARYRAITAEPGYLDGVLKQGAERVSPIAKSTVRLAKERMGLYTGV